MTKCVLAILFFSNVCIAQELFFGKIMLESKKSFSETDFDAYLWRKNKIKNMISMEEYSKTLNNKVIYLICGDTLVSFLVNMEGDTTQRSVQIKNDLLFKSNLSEKYLKIGIKTSLETVKNLKEKKQSEIILSKTTKLYVGSTQTKSEEFKLFIDKTSKFEIQSKYGYLFQYIFNSQGIILKTESLFIPWNQTKVLTVQSITELGCNCKSKMGDSNLFQTEIEVITLNKLLVKNGKDTTLIEEKDRQLLAFQGRNTLSENVNIENIKGHYTLIDLWATWCQPCLYAMPALGDIYEKYRYDGLRVVSISLDGETAKDKWKKTIEKENMYWDNYLMPEGFDADLCRQMGIKAIPHYILLDPDGRIMLENAPGPSDPNLTLVLDRLLKGKK